MLKISCHSGFLSNHTHDTCISLYKPSCNNIDLHNIPQDRFVLCYIQQYVSMCHNMCTRHTVLVLLTPTLKTMTNTVSRYDDKVNTD